MQLQSDSPMSREDNNRMNLKPAASPPVPDSRQCAVIFIGAAKTNSASSSTDESRATPATRCNHRKQHRPAPNMNASNPLPRKRLERRKRLGEAAKKEIHPCNYQFIYLFIHLLLMIIIFLDKIKLHGIVGLCVPAGNSYDSVVDQPQLRTTYQGCTLVTYLVNPPTK